MRSGPIKGKDWKLRLWRRLIPRWVQAQLKHEEAEAWWRYLKAVSERHGGKLTTEEMESLFHSAGKMERHEQGGP
jgi:hypothetical protein